MAQAAATLLLVWTQLMAHKLTTFSRVWWHDKFLLAYKCIIYNIQMSMAWGGWMCTSRHKRTLCLSMQGLTCEYNASEKQSKIHHLPLQLGS